MGKRTKPTPMRCPGCDKDFDFVWDNQENEWELESEWWHDPQDPKGWNFTCSRKCYLLRYNERCDPSLGTHSNPHKGCILR